MRIALCQMTSGIDPAANCRTIIDALASAKADGAQLLSTPEMAVLLDRDRARSTPLVTVEEDSPWLARLSEGCAMHGMWLHLGSMPLLDADSGKWVNRSFVIDDTGAIRARYDKIHLFDVQLATGENWCESASYKGGERAVTVDTPWARAGLAICYDVRFPALFANLSAAGARILFVPAAFTVPTGQAHWHLLLRARAVENACFVVATGQCGHHQDGRDTYGHSLVISPWGEVLLDMGEEAGLACIDIDLNEVDKVRAQVPVLANRRAFEPLDPA